MKERIIAFGKTPYEAKEYTDEGKGMIISNEIDIVMGIPKNAEYISIGFKKETMPCIAKNKDLP